MIDDEIKNDLKKFWSEKEREKIELHCPKSKSLLKGNENFSNIYTIILKGSFLNYNCFNLKNTQSEIIFRREFF